MPAIVLWHKTMNILNCKETLTQNIPKNWLSFSPATVRQEDKLPWRDLCSSLAQGAMEKKRYKAAQLGRKGVTQKKYAVQAPLGHQQGSWNTVSEQNSSKAKNETWEIYASAPIVCAQEHGLLEEIPTVSLHVKLVLGTTVVMSNFCSFILDVNQKSQA